MVLNKKSAIFTKIWFPLLAIFLFWGCANISRPMGGPRDLTPPKLVNADPPNMTRNFAAKEVNLEFDEFFKLTNQYQEISISPAMEKLPEYNIKKHVLQIKLQDTLQKNTTYVINFGKAIVDVNESNQMKNFTYVFSTGPHIDSLSISGTVTNTQTNLKEKDISVLLYPLAKDTAFFKKKKPAIFATTDSSGNFSLNNLREDKYRIYALKEAAANKIYDNEAELVAFIKDTINLTKDTSGIQLKLFLPEPENFRFTERRFDVDGKVLLAFNKKLQNPSVKILTPPALDAQKLVEFSTKKDSALVYMRNMDFDSLQIALSDNNKPIDTVVIRKSRKESFNKNMTFAFNIGQSNKLKPATDLIITANLPIENFNAGLISLREDSAYNNSFTIAKDTVLRKLVLKNRWKDNVSYELTFNEGAFTNIFGDKNKKYIKKFTVDKAENYSVLTLKVTVPEPGKSYVVELYQGEDKNTNILRSDVITKNTSLVYKNYLASKYYVRVIYDGNKNGRWDSGNIKLKQQPENIWVYEKEIALRPNWDAEEAVTIPKEPINP